MSQHTTSSTTFTVNADIRASDAVLLAAARRLHPALGGIPRSASLRPLSSASFGQMEKALSNELNQLESKSLRTLEARFATLAEVSGGREFVLTARGDSLREVDRLLQESHAALGAGDVSRADLLASQGDAILRRSIAGTARRWSREERLLTSHALEDALSSEGFQTSVVEREISTGVEGRRGSEVILALVEDGGSVTSDQAGFAGGECRDVWDQVKMRMSELGVQTSPIEVIYHENPDGGSLIERSALADGRSLANGVVRQREHPDEGPTALPSAVLNPTEIAIWQSGQVKGGGA